MTRKVIDWERLEIHYRAGVRSLKDIGTEFGVSDAAIIKRAKRDSWVRDLKAKINAKADAKVSAAMVSAEVSAQTKITENLRIEVESEVQARVRLDQRKDIQRNRKLVMSLLAELESQTDPEILIALQELGDLMRREDDKGQDKLNDLYHKVISLSSRVKTVKDLSESMRVLVGLERQAFGLDDKDNAPTDALTTLLHGISKSNGNGFQPIAVDPEHDD